MSEKSSSNPYECQICHNVIEPKGIKQAGKYRVKCPNCQMTYILMRLPKYKHHPPATDSEFGCCIACVFVLLFFGIYVGMDYALAGASPLTNLSSPMVWIPVSLLLATILGAIISMFFYGDKLKLELKTKEAKAIHAKWLEEQEQSWQKAKEDVEARKERAKVSEQKRLARAAEVRKEKLLKAIYSMTPTMCVKCKRRTDWKYISNSSTKWVCYNCNGVVCYDCVERGVFVSEDACPVCHEKVDHQYLGG